MEAFFRNLTGQILLTLKRWLYEDSMASAFLWNMRTLQNSFSTEHFIDNTFDVTNIELT